MNRFILLVSLSFLIALSSCNKEESLTVEEYIAQNNLETTELLDGVHIYYRTKTQGPKPSISSTVDVKYKGYLTDGTVFDQNESASFRLSEVVRGWQIGIRDMPKGSDATLIIPASQGYGSRKRQNIPANSTLVFDVVLKDFK